MKASIGIYYNLSGGRQRTTNEYLLADKKMSVFPVSFSLMASFMSAITLLGVTAENYLFGTQFVAINLSYIIGTPIAAFIFLPVFYELKVTSVYQVLIVFITSFFAFNEFLYLLSRVFVSYLNHYLFLSIWSYGSTEEYESQLR
jgi:Na+/pantothenate symporter